MTAPPSNPHPTHGPDGGPRHEHASAAPLRAWSLRFVLSLPFILPIRLYQITLGPFMGGQCRFYPTCSHYAIEAYAEHGPLRGSYLTLRRLLRCHPLGGHGYDPVPLRQRRG